MLKVVTNSELTGDTERDESVGIAGTEMVVITPLGREMTVSWPTDSEIVETPTSGILSVVTNSELVREGDSEDAVD